MKTQTAVELFWEEAQDILPSSVDTETGIKLVRAFENAKEMEKQQITNAWVESSIQGSNHDLLEWEIKAETEFAERHYKETYETQTS
jgi:hypothetical protein